jgi:hypothetical protein
MPSRTLPCIASLTPEIIDIRIINEYVEDIQFDQIDCDLIALTGMIHHYLINTKKKKGCYIIIIHYITCGMSLLNQKN